MKFKCLILLFLFLLLIGKTLAQPKDLFLGIDLRPEVRSIVKEIEGKTGKKINTAFVEQENFTLGSSFITDEQEAVIQIDARLADTPQKLEAVIAHELLHLRLRVSNFPVFLFSPTIKTARGLAQDVEQPNVNDLASMIEHQIFKSEMKKLGLNEVIDIAGDTLKQAKAGKGRADGQTDSINYARAILEYANPKDAEELRKVYEANGWKRSLQNGKEIADIISLSKLQIPQDAETAFLKCLIILYQPPNSAFTFRLNLDKTLKAYRRMIINTVRKTK